MTAAGAPEESRGDEPALAYFGRVTAGQCHELVNVFNVVNELAGLLEDLLPRAREGRPGALERVGELAGRIQAQLKRGQTILRHVHRFAHTADEQRLELDAREVVERVVFLATRQARLRETALSACLPDERVVLESTPLWLEQAIHLGLELLLEGADERRRISVTLASRPDGATVTLESADPAPRDAATAARLVAIAALLDALGGEVREVPRHAVDDRLVLFVPHGRHDGAAPEPDRAAPGGAGGGR